MNNVHLSEEAQNDLVEIKTYIEEELMNPSAALRTVKFMWTAFCTHVVIICASCLMMFPQMKRMSDKKMYYFTSAGCSETPSL